MAAIDPKLRPDPSALKEQPRPWGSPRAGVLLGILLVLAWGAAGTLGFMLIEGWSFLDALYMTVITISTVGYHEVHPLSGAGRLWASFVIVGGLSTVLYTFARLGQWVFEGELLDVLERRRMKAELAKLKEHYIVCGFGRVGRPVAEGLAQEGLPFCVVERDPALEDELKRFGFLYLLGDATEEAVLREAGVERARALLALLPTDADNLYLTITAKGLNPAIRVIARALDEKAEVKLKRVGADRVVSPYRIAGRRVLQAAVKPALVEFLELVTHRQYLPLSLEEIPVREGAPLVGRSLAEAKLRQRYGVIVVAIQRADGRMEFNPDPNAQIWAGDVLVALGREGDLKALERDCGVHRPSK